MTKWFLKIFIVIGVFAAVSAFAELLDRGSGLIYDTERDITWLKDANYAATSGYESEYYTDGHMQWDEAMTWAEGMEYECYDDWRLPNSLVNGSPCIGADCQETEALSLFIYEDISQSMPGPFVNIKSYYWSQTEYPDNTDMAKNYGPTGGYGNTLKSSYLFAWAVRDGDSMPCDTDSDDETEDETDSDGTGDENKNSFKVTSECFISTITSTASLPDNAQEICNFLFPMFKGIHNETKHGFGAKDSFRN